MKKLHIALLAAAASAPTYAIDNVDVASFRHLSAAADSIAADSVATDSVAADTVKPLTRWKKFDPERQEMMKAALEKVLAKPGLSKNVYELVSKSLGDAEVKKVRCMENKAKTQKQAKAEAFLKGEPLKVFVSGGKGKDSPAHKALLKDRNVKVVPAQNSLLPVLVTKNALDRR